LKQTSQISEPVSQVETTSVQAEDTSFTNAARSRKTTQAADK
jgi:hypothetical protein